MKPTMDRSKPEKVEKTAEKQKAQKSEKKERVKSPPKTLEK